MTEREQVAEVLRFSLLSCFFFRGGIAAPSSRGISEPQMLSCDQFLLLAPDTEAVRQKPFVMLRITPISDNITTHMIIQRGLHSKSFMRLSQRIRSLETPHNVQIIQVHHLRMPQAES